MTYGHAERTLAAIRLLEADTRRLLSSQDPRLTPDEREWPRGVADSASRRLQSTGISALSHGEPGMLASSADTAQAR
jgi:hypothetical protein